MAAPNLERMYECGDALANVKDKNFAEHQSEYEEILLGVKGDDQCKRLASQFIARFYANFPDLGEQSINAMLDLCEDINVDIRKQAIKDLPTLCRDNNKTTLAKIADVLTQLLTTEDTGEMTTIQNSLMNLYRRDPQGAIMGIFSQIHIGDEVVSERSLRLLHTKLKTGSIDLNNKDAKAQMVAEIKKVFASDNGVTADEFPRLMSLLEHTDLPKTVAGQIEIVNMIMSMAELDKTADFDYTSVELTDRLLQCAQHCLPFFSNQVKSTAFCEYIFLKVLPHYHQLPDLPEMDTRAQLIKILAELTASLGGLEESIVPTVSKNVFERLIDYMPLPPVDEDGTLAETPNLEFTKVECLMYTFHCVGKQNDAFLKEDEERLKDFRLRLQYLARGVTGYLKKLREFLSSPAGRKADSEDVKIKKIALRSTENIQTMIRDLFHSPPHYKANIALSWREGSKGRMAEKRRMITGPGAAAANKGKDDANGVKKAKVGARALYMDVLNDKKKGGGAGGPKRPVVSNYKPSGKSVRPTGLYQPPSGKFSSKITKITWDE